jgi:hypothetical protein
VIFVTRSSDFLRSRNKTVLKHGSHEFLDGMHTQFIPDLTVMRAHRVVADMKSLGDLPIGISFAEAAGDLDLALDE